MSEQNIKEKQNRNLEITSQIKGLKEQLYMLKQEQKINDVFIFSNCVHNWIKDRNDFLRMQGGNLNNFTSFNYESTRKKKNDIDISGYIPNGKTMAIPKENI